jgi:hypothetical protein
MRSEVLKAVKMSTLVFWAAQCELVGRYQLPRGTYYLHLQDSPEDGGSMILRNVRTYLQIYTVLKFRRLTWKVCSIFNRILHIQGYWNLFGRYSPEAIG